MSRPLWGALWGGVAPPPGVHEARLEPMHLQHLPAVLAVEQQAYAHPWRAQHFQDVLRSGYQAQVLMGDTQLLGYFVAMQGVDEVHLLNVTVAPAWQRQGWARVLLDALALWARGCQARWLWLEVRQSNARAIAVYEAHGYERVGLRKDYYPGAGGGREHAWVMRLALQEG